eukprot:TRINITY_DN11980_c0_g1_i1.p2 TRINITY_DN11980_c0_g1~~TRINITY_DN11980_c0_g1_i1.p2  ORF type:complete len:109 (+),score=3.79 TRINITY_DN11980_c0_g1_i1:302-628(+)
MLPSISLNSTPLPSEKKTLFTINLSAVKSFTGKGTEEMPPVALIPPCHSRKPLYQYVHLLPLHSSLSSQSMKCYGSLIICLLYTSDAADDLLCVDLGGCRIIKKTKLI